MKFYTFLPGFILVFILALLVVLNTVFKIDIPVIKNIKNPLLVLLILGFMMCAFGTLAHSMVRLFKEGKIDIFVIAMIISGILLLIIGGLTLFSKQPALGGFLTKTNALYTVSALIAIKIVLATVRMFVISK